MSTSMSQALNALKADIAAALETPPRAIGHADAGGARYDLFHAPNSICSQKVRVVLAHLGIAYTSYSLNIFKGQTYLPAHVRLRMIGCETSGAALTSGHSGSTSVATTGCDPAVVPTLIDHQTDEVIVDSKRICFRLDDTADEHARLRPGHLSALVDEQLAVVDNLPNYQMLTGRPPDGDATPVARPVGSGVDFAMSKVRRCDDYLQAYGDDPILVRGYSAKRAKELDAAQQLFTEDAMRKAYAKAEAACEGLEALLKKRRTRWMFSDEPSMADLFWTIELLRMANMGAAHFWTDGRRPAVEALLEQGRTLAAVRSAIIDWPGALY